jgi:nitrous oxidase accessory protein
MSGFANAETLTAAPGQPLQAVLDGARAGDVVELSPGDYHGSVRIDRSLQLVGRQGAVLDGDGADNVITVGAPDVTVRGVTIRGSGRDLQAMNS